jgi:ribosome biogenesis GTPase A
MNKEKIADLARQMIEVAEKMLVELSDDKVTVSKAIPKSVEEVLEVIRTRSVAEHFFDFYSSKGWRVGNVSMKDWRSAARNWLRRNGGLSQNSPQKTNETVSKVKQWEEEQKNNPITESQKEELKKLMVGLTQKVSV